MTANLRRTTVLHILAALDFGGVESQMRLIAKNRNFSRYDRAFCAIGKGGSVLADLRLLEVRADALGVNARIPSVTAMIALFRYIRNLRPEIVHLHGAEANFHGALAAKLARVPVIVAEEIGIPRHSRRARMIFRQVYCRCDQLVAVSEAVAKRIIELGEARLDQISVIHNSFSEQVFRPREMSDSGLKLGFVGRLEAVKNPVCAIEAVALLRCQGITASLTIIGEGSQRAALEARIEDLGLSDQVTISGFSSRPFDLLADFHLYLQPSLTEGFGLAICEAMSAGLPVIASAVGGAPEIIAHGRTGWLLDQPDPRALANLITSVAFDKDGRPKDLSAIAEAARVHVTDSFSPAAYLAKCDRLYDRLSAHKGLGHA